MHIPSRVSLYVLLISPPIQAICPLQQHRELHGLGYHSDSSPSKTYTEVQTTIMNPHPLHTLFDPRSIAVIGASPDKARIRGRILDFLVHGEYGGQVLPVNPSYKEINGAKCFASIGAASAAGNGPIDLAVIVIPAAAVLGELERCAAAGVKHALIVSSGFAEEGGEQVHVQARMSAIAKSTGMRVIGPNSEGFFSAPSRARATFSPTVESVVGPDSERHRVSARRVGVVAQSGGMGFGVMHRGHADGLAFSHVISTGNEADVDVADCLDFMVDDSHTDIIALYLECVRDVAGFEAACARAALSNKPIVAIKVGRSTAGGRATQSHTGSIAGWDAAYDAFFRKYGVVAAADLSEAIAILGLLATCPRIDGNRIAVLTGSGGAGALVSDVLERNGLVLPVLGAATQQAIGALVPSYASAQNPVDVTAGATRSGALVKSADILLGSHEIDLVVSVHSLTSETSMPFDPQELARGAGISGKSLTCYCYTAPSRFGRNRMADAGVFVHTDLQLLATAIAKVLARRPQIARVASSQTTGIDPEMIERTSSAATQYLRKSNTEVLCEYEVKELLRQCGINASSELLCRSAEEVVTAAENLGYPVALKIQSPEITHKTEIGAVRLGLSTAETVRSAYADVLAAAARGAPDPPS